MTDPDGMALSPPLKRLIAIALGLCFLALAVVAARWGVADVMMHRALAAMARWHASDASPPSLDDWLKVRDDFIAAQRLDPANPSLHEALGLLHSRRIARGPGVEVYQEQALEHFRAAAVARPTSPYTWGNITLTKYRLGAVDPEFRKALNIAQRLGPWEPELQLTSIDLGLAAWDELTPDEQKLLQATLVRAMKRQGDKVVQLAEKRGRLESVCAVGEIATKLLKCQ